MISILFELLAYYCMSTFVTSCIRKILAGHGVIVTNTYLGGTSMVSKINQLITRCQQRTLRRAAAILMLSDKHDDLFYSEIAKIKGASETDNILSIGSDYAIVRKQEISKVKLVDISEVHHA